MLCLHGHTPVIHLQKPVRIGKKSFLPVLWKHGVCIEVNQLNDLQIQTIADENSNRLWKMADDYAKN